MPRKTLEERFWEKVKIAGPDECWEWQGSTSGTGHGRIRVDGRLEYAHRVVFMLAGEPVPADKLSCHECDNPPCVNIRHLSPGTRSKNLQDAYDRGLRFGNKKGITKDGIGNVKAKLNDDLVRIIRSDSRIYAVIATELGVAKSTICRVKRGYLWDHVT